MCRSFMACRMARAVGIRLRVDRIIPPRWLMSNVEARRLLRFGWLVSCRRTVSLGFMVWTFTVVKPVVKPVLVVVPV